MSNAKNLYTTTGKKYTDIIKFLDDYETVYYYESGFVAEQRINDILKKGIQSRKDAYDILAWKLGGVEKNKTNANIGAAPTEIIQCKGGNWFFDKEVNGKTQSQGTYPGGKIVFAENKRKNDYLERFEGKGEIGVKLKELKDEFDANEKSNKNEEEKTLEADRIAANILNQLAKDAPKGIGPVYMITLLYFLTQGKRYPIYDQFAHAALDVIFDEHEIPLGSEVTKKTVSTDKTANSFGEKIISGKDSVYSAYMGLINKFEKEFNIHYYADSENTNRKADRALWAYGHMFNLVEPKKGIKL